MSEAERVKEAAIKSKPSSTAKAISASSFGLMKGMDRVTPGTLMPL